MPLIHMDGLPGVGKSTVTRALRARGYAAVDVDDGLCVWEHKTSGEICSPDDFPGGRGADAYDWVASPTAVRMLADLAGETVVFVAGSIANRAALADCFGGRIAVVVSLDALNDRLDGRDEGAWGHEPQHREWLPNWHATFLARAADNGALIVDAEDLAVDAVAEVIIDSSGAETVTDAWLDTIWATALRAAESEFSLETRHAPPAPER